MAGSNNINVDLYTRYRALIGRIDQAVSRGTPHAHRPRMVDENAPATFSEPWRNASVSMADQVTRKLIETQADSTDESDEDDSMVDETDGADDTDTDETEPTEPTEPTAPTEPTTPTEPTAPTEPTTPTTPDPGPIDMPPMPPTDPVVEPPPVDPTPVDPTPVDPAPVDPAPVDPTPVVPPPTLPTSPTLPTDPVVTPPSAPAPVIPAAAAALNMLFKAQAVANDPVLQYKRALFRTLDSDSDGLVSTKEISKAVTAAGGDSYSAAALNGALDPASTGAVTQQQFVDRLPAASFDYFDPMTGEPIYNPYSAGGAVSILEAGVDVTAKLERSAAVSAGQTETALTPFDFNRNGAVDLHELMVAVQARGGSSQSARAIFSHFDPKGTGAITNQQFNENFPTPTYDMTTGEISYGSTELDQGVSALFFSMVWSQQPADRASRGLFYGLDPDSNGMMSGDDLTRAVTDAGGSVEQASALRAQLDPNNTGAISMEQFIDNLPPVTIGANGVAAADIPMPAPPPVMVFDAQAPTTPPMPQNLSNDMLSVLLAQQQNEEVWRGII